MSDIYMAKCNHTLKKEFGNICIEWMMKMLRGIPAVESLTETEMSVMWGCTDTDFDMVTDSEGEALRIANLIRDLPFTHDLCVLSIEPIKEPEDV